MLDKFTRAELILGKESIQKLSESKVIVFGVGGVGSFVAEGLARCGVGTIGLVDSDTVCVTNINRQLIATTKTIGEQKVLLMKERIKEINPDAKVEDYNVFYSEETTDKIDLSRYDYIVDAIDTVTSKILLVEKANEINIPIISCMGAGNKLDPTKFEVTDIYKTSICPLAKVMRRELRARGVKTLKVVYSKETPIKPNVMINNKRVPGSVSFVPPVAGLIIAGEVIKDIINVK